MSQYTEDVETFQVHFEDDGKRKPNRQVNAVVRPTIPVEFREPESKFWKNRGGGRKFTPIPEELKMWLNKSYMTGLFAELSINGDGDRVVDELVRVARIFCRNEGRTLKYEVDKQESVVRLMMKDKRPYTKKEDEPRWLRSAS